MLLCLLFDSSIVVVLALHSLSAVELAAYNLAALVLSSLLCHSSSALSLLFHSSSAVGCSSYLLLGPFACRLFFYTLEATFAQFEDLKPILDLL